MGAGARRWGTPRHDGERARIFMQAALHRERSHLPRFGSCLRGRAWMPRLPRAMVDAVLAPGLGDEVRACAAGGAKLFPVSQALPGVWRIDLGPAGVVRIVALVGTLQRVGGVAGRDEQG